MAPVTRRQYLGVSGAATLTGLAGCSDFFSTSSGPRSGELNKLGISMYVRGGSWITAFKEAAEFYCKDQDIKVDIIPNQQSANKQASDIRQFANQGYDGIIASVWSTGAIKSAIDFADKQGVPVFTANADTASSKAKLYVGFSNTVRWTEIRRTDDKGAERAERRQGQMARAERPRSAGEPIREPAQSGVPRRREEKRQDRGRRHHQRGVRTGRGQEQGESVAQLQRERRRHLLRQPLDGARVRRRPSNRWEC